jgi:DNA-binding transcriptional ArsR family regulator
MDADSDLGCSNVATIAAAIGEPARAKILYCLLDGHARTSTELSVVAGVTPSTASAHLGRLKTAGLVGIKSQGKHRYYRLAGIEVAAVLESMNVLAGGAAGFDPSTPRRLRNARTCYDHLAGAVGVGLHDSFQARGWLTSASVNDTEFEVTTEGMTGFGELGIDIAAVRRQRRRFACGCLDWSERRPHLGGALGAAVLRAALGRGWFEPHLDSRALGLTTLGQRQIRARLGGEFNLDDRPE